MLVETDLSEHDQAGGVIQGSPGIKEIPTSGKMLIVPPDRSLFRIKMYDDPVPQTQTHGLVHYVVEYNHPASILHQGYKKWGIRPEFIHLTIDQGRGEANH